MMFTNLNRLILNPGFRRCSQGEEGEEEDSEEEDDYEPSDFSDEEEDSSEDSEESNWSAEEEEDGTYSVRVCSVCVWMSAVGRGGWYV